MKKILLLFSFSIFLFGLSANGQVQSKPWTFGAGVALVDFSGPITKDYFEFDRFKGVGRIYLGRYLNPSFNWKTDLTFGKVWRPAVLAYPTVIDGIYTAETMIDWGTTLEYKFDNGYIFREEAVIGPYLFVGFGINNLYDDVNTYVPFGLGLNIRPADVVTLNLQFGYKKNIDNSFDYTQHSFGLNWNFGGAASGGGGGKGGGKMQDADGDGVDDNTDECPFSYGSAEYFGCPDSDGDGIGDSRDNCPYQKGSAANNGCPGKDSDSDGIADIDDKCPNEKGPKSNNGCPEVDTDGDGVIDNKDYCPKEPGPASNNGCPLKDTDGDGIPDESDDCPDQAGTEDNNGCPVDGGTGTGTGTTTGGGPTYSPGKAGSIKDMIYFSEGTSDVAGAQAKTLDNVIQYLNDNPEYNLAIIGHASSSGGDVTNMKLSLRRAEQTYLYLKSKGVASERMVLVGYGEHNPKYDNNSPAEAAKNRRVELEVFK